MMSAFSWVRTGAAEALKRRFLSSHVARRCLHKTSLASREERPYRLVRARVVLVEDPSLPGIARGFIPEWYGVTVVSFDSCSVCEPFLE